MKKLFVVLFALMLIVPFKAYADEPIVGVSGYSIQATEGSEVILSIKSINFFDGTITYNKDELQYVSTKLDDPNVIEGEKYTGALKITKNIPGELSFTYQELVVDGTFAESKLEEVLIKFVVLKVPESRKINIKYVQKATGVIYNYSFNVRKPEDKVTTKDDTDLGNWVENPKPHNYVQIDECPKCEECPKVEECSECEECGECDIEEDKTLLYVSWGVSGVLLLALIVVILKNKKKPEINKE